eukprot:CAMPEP_0113890952 /NCGR_PEP_ID=MMETSP0780_2-20120614/14462_1 /TAXON_ID=652834 /ORGANISM="Palpitomonas bilix" /LENGTH=1122 /DNA_ID=CAMNT_0000880467 /DNA_START=88 /DNA_END=3456 /DNA_ORIENTATION=- /assembly_acc=CAM_ASM_000599
MSAKPLREYDAKRLITYFMKEKNLKGVDAISNALSVQVTKSNFASIDSVLPENNWLNTTKLVAKPDQLIKRRGKAGLVALNLDWAGAKAWIGERMAKDITIQQVTGELNNFIVEPFLPHEQKDEYYVCIQSIKEGDEILFYHEGGVDVGDVDAKAKRMTVSMRGDDFDCSASGPHASLLEGVPAERKEAVSTYLNALFEGFRKLHFTYLEINPLVVTGSGSDIKVTAVDMAAKIDEVADFLAGKTWHRAAPGFDFPPAFGRAAAPEEEFIAELDSKTGASLKLTILNPNGRVWTMVAGGGASVVYADTIADYGFGHELGNYGEYSGDPSENFTYEYAKTVLKLLLRAEPQGEAPFEGKVLIIGGGIANFTNVAETFKGIARALTEKCNELISQKVRIFIRRGGPNYQEGLKNLRNLGERLNLPLQAFGPETHITAVVPLALGIDATAKPASRPKKVASMSDFSDSDEAEEGKKSAGGVTMEAPSVVQDPEKRGTLPWYSLFTPSSRAFIYGMQPKAAQNMLDFDFACKREVPSVAGMIYPFAGDHFQKFYWGTNEKLIPVYSSSLKAMKKHKDVEIVVNFASFRSVYESTLELLDLIRKDRDTGANELANIRCIAIIAEGVPESQARAIRDEARELGVVIIGPATVGGIVPGCFRIGNAGGMIDNIIDSKLYRSGSVAYVSRSGGMSNELNNIISREADGVAEGIAIGGDRYPSSTFLDHLLRYEANPKVKFMVLLGEVGGDEEYRVIDAVKSGKIKKPLVAWCVGTCAKIFPYEVQFGHAGALAKGQLETADAKNKAMIEAGIRVPNNFNELSHEINAVYTELLEAGVIKPMVEPPKPIIPMDYQWAKKLGLIRKPANFVSTIVDDRGEELLYAGMPITQVFDQDIGIGGVISLLWFKRRLPNYCCKFLEMILMVTADHGPAVAGAHNTIVTARAGKDLISALVSGLLTIGPRFGGAVDGAAKTFSAAFDKGLSPFEFLEDMRKKKELIPGIGHRVKSLSNPDMRVQILKEFAIKNFPSTEILTFAMSVEKLTTKKKSNLILNVDGCIGSAFVDMVRSCGAFSREEADEYMNLGCLNGLFVLGRSTGFIAHYLDQMRLKQGLYRHPWDDISYIVPDDSTSV